MRTIGAILLAAVLLYPLTAGDFTETGRMMLLK
jgi:hypothetical protein